MNFICKKSVIVGLVVLLIVWFLWFLTHFLIKFKLVGDKVVELNYGEEYEEYGAIATFLGKDLDVQIQTNIDTNKEGRYAVYYKARNMFGIVKSIKRNIVVKDKESPKITLKGDNPIILGLDEKYVEPGYIATDNIEGDLTNNVVISDNIDIKNYGEYKIIYKVKDSNNHTTKKVRKVIVKDKKVPTINLKGSTIVDVLLGSEYSEEGFTAKDNIDGDITDKVEVINEVDYKKLGSYQIIYKVTDSSDNVTIVKRTINIVKKLLEYKEEYYKINNTQRGWWSNNKFDHQRPSGGADELELKKYNTYFMGPDEKIIYLTYDEGSNDTYLPEIVEVLDKNDVKATFFLCRNYMLMNKDLIRKMVENGHLIGNHTFHHYEMPKLANKANFDKYLYEIRGVEETYKEITGKTMEKIYREPKGEWSYRSLKIVSDLGYKTFFYSADYYDYADDVSKDLALKKMLDRYHNGAIYLFHPKNKGNLEALEDFIIEMKRLGYKFDLVKNINY